MFELSSLNGKRNSRRKGRWVVETDDVPDWQSKLLDIIYTKPFVSWTLSSKEMDDMVRSAESCQQDKGTHSSFGIHVDNLYVTG